MSLPAQSLPPEDAVSPPPEEAMRVPPEDAPLAAAPRPGDAARRALRAARERAGAEREPALENEGLASGDTARRAPGTGRVRPEAERGRAPDETEEPPSGGAAAEEVPAGSGPSGDGAVQAPVDPAGSAARRTARKEARPGDAARAALRAAVAAPARGEGSVSRPRPVDAAGDETAPVPGGNPVSRPRPAAAADGATAADRGESPASPGRGTSAPAGVPVPAQGEEPVSRARPTSAQADAPLPAHGEDPVPRSRSTTAPGARPADIAREALRAARREALRAEAEAEAEETAARGDRTAQPRTRGGSRAAGSPSSTAPRPVLPGPEGRAARTKAVQDMRHYLANAFRMPTLSDNPEDEARTPESSAGSRGHTHPDRSSSAPAVPTGQVRPDLSLPAPVTPTGPTEPDHPAPVSAPPRLPDTMATPHRDTELRRTFQEFAPRAVAGEGAPFAGTWWGNAWVAALEQGALDARRLARGRGYADQGHVDAITVTPGLVLAYVRGSRPRPYRVQVRVRTLEDADWARFLDAAADRPGHIAALLDKELPQSLADCGVPLLPGPGDLVPRCSCPDSGHPCKHAAALCYQTARLLDADPFVLLLLRGRGEKDLLDALSRRSAARAARAAQDRQAGSLPGVRATDALAPRRLPPLPPPLPAPPHPGQPPVYPAAPGGPDPFALDQLATDAAARAHTLLGTGRDPVGELTLWQDAVRLAAARPGSGLTATTRTLYVTLATAAGRTPSDLARAVAAWRQGGSAGLAVLEEPWDPPAGRFDRARPLLLAADLPAFRPWRNRLTHPRGHVQLRLGHDGLWYAYESEPDQEDWWPRGTPDLDPVGALTGLGAPEGM